MNGALFPLAVLAVMAAQEPAGRRARDRQPAEAAKPIVVRAKTLYTGAGEPVANGIVVIESGKIAGVGPGVPIPGGAIELTAEAVTPGLVDAASTAGQRGAGAEEIREITPSFRAVDDLDSTDPDFERLARRGVTSVWVGPSDRNVIGGLAGVVKTFPTGSPPVVKPEVALKGSLGFLAAAGNRNPRGLPFRDFRLRRPNARPAVVTELRGALFAAERAKSQLGRLDPDTRRLVDALERRIPARLAARGLGELRAALRVAAEFDLDLQVEDAFEAHRCLRELAAAKASVVLGAYPDDPTGRAYAPADEVPDLSQLTALDAAGIPVALSARGADRIDDLAVQMRAAVRYGAARELALRAVTRAPARILGVGERIGSLEAGRDADLVLWSGDPFEGTSAPQVVLVDGRIASDLREARR